jgi:hypothetical protein
MAFYYGGSHDGKEPDAKRRKGEEVPRVPGLPGLKTVQLDFGKFCGGVPGTMTNFENFVFGQIPTCDDVCMQEPQPGLKPEDITRAFEEGIRQADIEYRLKVIKEQIDLNNLILSSLIPGVSDEEIAEINLLLEEQTALMAELSSL